eukprot:scaffold4285_cov109-Isochrysis_galbana.AAC.6
MGPADHRLLGHSGAGVEDGDVLQEIRVLLGEDEVHLDGRKIHLLRLLKHRRLEQRLRQSEAQEGLSQAERAEAREPDAWETPGTGAWDHERHSRCTKCGSMAQAGRCTRLASVVDELAEEDVAGQAAVLVGEVGALLRERVVVDMRDDILTRHLAARLLAGTGCGGGCRESGGRLPEHDNKIRTETRKPAYHLCNKYCSQSALLSL